MSGDHSASPFLEVLKVRRKLALHIFLGVMLVMAAGAFLTLQYSASAVVALDPRSVLDEGGNRTQTPVDLAWIALTDKQIQAIIRQFQLNSGLTRLRAQNQVFPYVRSNILLHELDSGGGAPTIQVSFVGSGPSTVVDVANAIAQSLAQPTTAPKQQTLAASPKNLSEKLDKVRTTLQLLSQTKKASVPQAELQNRFKIDANLQAERKESVIELAALDQQATQAAIAASKARAQMQTPPPPNPAAIAIEKQIKQAQTHLAELRQRYTDEYPEVEQAEETLANLDGQLSRIPVEKPRPQPVVRAAGPTADEIRITQERDQVLEHQQGLDEAIKDNENQAEVLRQRAAGSKTFAQDYAFEQQRYETLLKQQQAGANGATGGAAPRFIVIQNAAHASASGLAVKPLFWIASLFFALFVACFSVFAAEQFNPAVENDPTPRSFHTS